MSNTCTLYVFIVVQVLTFKATSNDNE